MKKLLKEFKDFISKGNVMDLAVGMIIGAAFTAIISAVVNGILKPLLDMIPGTNGSALQVLLKEALLDEVGNVVKPAVILDFGAVISAIITFLLTALVLFIIVKAFNAIRKASEKAAQKAKEDLEKLKAKKDNKEEESADETNEPVEDATLETPAKIEGVVPTNETNELLKQIITLLEEQKDNKQD